MKILSIGNFGVGWDGSICDEEHIAKALEDAGHEVTRCQRNVVLEQDLTEPQYDFILLSQWDGYRSDVMFEFFERLQGCPVVYWAFDYQADGQEWHEELVRKADMYLSKRIADSKYPNWQWLSQDFAPWFMGRHNEKPERDIDVLFTGSYLSWATERNETLKAIDQNFNLEIHSITPDAWFQQGFKNSKEAIMDHQLTSLYARSKVNISIDHTIEAGYWSDRNAQIMACGGLVLTRYVPLMEARFRDKVDYFYNVEDCLQKIKHLLDNDMERKYKGSVGYVFAQDNLMVKHRVKDLLTIVESIL